MVMEMKRIFICAYFCWSPFSARRSDHLKRGRRVSSKKFWILKNSQTRNAMIASQRTNEMLGRLRSAAAQLPAWTATRPKMSAQGQSFCITKWDLETPDPAARRGAEYPG